MPAIFIIIGRAEHVCHSNDYWCKVVFNKEPGFFNCYCLLTNQDLPFLPPLQSQSSVKKQNAN